MSTYAFPLARFRAYVAKLNGRNAAGTLGIVSEFNALNQAAAEAWLDKRVTVARERANEPRNRYSNVHPYDDNVVRLEPRADDATSTYINASHVHAGVAGRKRAYVAAQGPLENTAGDFWRMVWQQGARMVVMVARFVEHRREKVFRYLPLQPDDAPHEYDGVVRVRTVSVSELDEGVVHRRLQLEHAGAQRSIDHFQVASWPDFGVPDSPSVMCALVRITHEYAAQHALAPTAPIVVHCSAGIGRTGTYIVCSALVDQLVAAHHSSDLELSPFHEVHALRGQRMGSVQTADQYAYIYSFLVRWLSTKGLME